MTAYVTPATMGLGNMLKLVSRGMVYDNLSTVSPMWDFVYGKKVDTFAGRAIEHALRTRLGYSAVGTMSINGGAFKAGEKATIIQGTAYPKKYTATLELNSSEVELALKDIGAYGKPVAEEVEAKGIALARILSQQAYNDGVGVIGTISAIAFDNAVATAYATARFTISATYTDRGFVGWFQIGDRIKIATTAGTQKVKINNNGNTVSYFVVEKVDRANRYVYCRAYDSSDANVAITAVGPNAADPAAADVVYRMDTFPTDGTFYNIAGYTSATELSTVSNDIMGLEGLVAATYKIHNVQRGSGVEGTIYSAGGNPIDSKHFQGALSQASNACGASRYSYKQAFLSTEAYDSLLEANETDRRFASGDSLDRGSKGMGFVYGKQRVEFVPDEFCPSRAIWILPEGDVLQFHGSDFEPVSHQDMPEWHLKVNGSSGTHMDIMNMYMTGMGEFVCMHPASLIKIHNFTV